jgi:NAD(P)-dependent dehydrogenase (short-subunit alcohol dehydrogenase family)
MDLELSGKRALVTGSTLGIGRAIAEALLKEGAEVVINGRDDARVSKVASELAALGKVSGVTADLSTAGGANTLIKRATEPGPIDILVNNAGYFDVVPFEEIDDAAWLDIFETNVMSGVRLSRAMLPGMLERNWGRMIFIGSDQSSKPNPALAHYAMTKTAVVSIARSLAEQTKGTGVTVNTVQVAPTWTEGVEAFMKSMAEIEGITPEEMSKEYFANGEGNTSLLSRWAKPTEIADVVAFLCSQRAAAINGSAPRADGGMVRSLF